MEMHLEALRQKRSVLVGYATQATEHFAKREVR